MSRSSWMLKPKSLVRLLGAEYELMRDGGVLTRFYISSVLVVTIMLITWVSIEYALELLFHNTGVGLALAIFFCLLFFCIYTFLLNTFAKENRVYKGLLNASNIIRIGFVVFMGFLVAQPLVILIYATRISPILEKYKNDLMLAHVAKIDSLTKAELLDLQNNHARLVALKTKYFTSFHDDEISKTARKIDMLNANSASLIKMTGYTIERSSFFLFRVQQVNRQFPGAWIITLGIILLVLTPGYLIFSLSSQHEYYKLKKEQEKRFIMKAYRFFCSTYCGLFDHEVDIYSRFEDPPFNTIRKQRPIPAPMNDFLKKYLYIGS